MRIWSGVAMCTAILIAAAQLYGQSDQAAKSFEVASVKPLPQPNPGASTGGGPGTSDPGRWWRSNVTMASLLIEAFQIQGFAIVGPDWLRSPEDRYEITAKVPAGATRADVPLMLRRLLAERFGLTFHREPKDVPGYALVTARTGSKLKTASGTPTSISGRNGFADLPNGIAPGVTRVESVGSLRRLSAGAMSMAQLADYLAAQTATLVQDFTELHGNYDIVLYFSKPLPISANPAETPADDRFDLVTALREQLGLELQKRKVPAELLVIDHIEQTPSPN